MPPPHDRSIALACTLATLRARFIHARCQCGHSTQHPIRLLLIENRARPDQTLADTIVRLQCGSGRHRGILTLHLCETVYGCSARLNPSQAPGWAILLHDGVAAL